MRIAFALLAVTLLPGFPLAALLAPNLRHGWWWMAVAGTLGLLWTLLATLVLTVARLPLAVPLLLAATSAPLLVALWYRPWRRRALAHVRSRSVSPSTTVVVVLTILALAYPLVTVQQGLPTGDVQKAIFWATRIIETRAPPAYAESLRFNRDPGDFATPGLHSLTAAVMALSGNATRGPAWLSLAAAVLLAGTTAAIASVLTRPSARLLPLLTFLLAATNVRFLRYTVTPGYHYQNLLGELFLLTSLLFLLLAVGGRGAGRFTVLSVLLVAVLPVVHQFSAFLALFVWGLTFLVLLIRYRGEVASLLWRLPWPRRLGALLLVLAIAALAYASGPLRGKLPHLFTTTPHLAAHVVPLESIPALLGIPFTLLGLVGALAAVVQLRRRMIDWRWTLLLLWAILFFALAQGARTVIDIPSARTLFYLAPFLALFGSLVVDGAANRLRAWWPRTAPLVIPVALVLVLAPTAGEALNTTLQSIDHSLQANATLTPETLELLSYLSAHPPPCSATRGTSVSGDAGRGSGGAPRTAELAVREGASSRQDPKRPCPDAILIDDWNRRRTTWAILSPYRMLTRVGADLAVIAREEGQSPQRRQQYETLLDFEKIYALGNTPDILPLLEKYRIAYVVGVRGLSDDVFSHNPDLTTAFTNAEVILYTPRSSSRPPTAAVLDRDVLANDLGDAEDVFAHLPLSALAPQISAALVENGRTVRDIRSATSSLGLNVGAYLPRRWDADGDRRVDADVELSLWAVGNGARGRVTRGTTVFAEFALADDGALHHLRAIIPQGELPIDEQGLAFITLRLDRAPLRLDRAAARLIR